MLEFLIKDSIFCEYYRMGFIKYIGKRAINMVDKTYLRIPNRVHLYRGGAHAHNDGFIYRIIIIILYAHAHAHNIYFMHAYMYIIL